MQQSLFRTVGVYAFVVAREEDCGDAELFAFDGDELGASVGLAARRSPLFQRLHLA